MKKSITIFSITIAGFFSCTLSVAQKNASPHQNTNFLKREMKKQQETNKKLAAKIQFQYFVIKAGHKTFGYDVYADGHLYLHQPTVPGMSGTTGFADTASAGKVARLAIKKIKHGEVPPTITIQELKQLKVTPPEPKHPK